MTVTVPAQDKTGAYQKQAQITTLAAIPSTSPAASQSAQLLNQTSIELVNTLMAQGKLSAASILSTVAYKGTLPILTQITALQTQITNNGDPMGMKAAVLSGLQMQAVTELMNSAQMSAATVLSTMSYIGGAAQ